MDALSQALREHNERVEKERYMPMPHNQAFGGIESMMLVSGGHSATYASASSFVGNGMAK